MAWGILYFRCYLLNVHFGIYTDHENLEKKAKNGKYNPRVKHWLEMLSAYTYTLDYSKARANGYAEILSRLLLQSPKVTTPA